MRRVRFTVHRTVGEARLQAGVLEEAGLSVEVRRERLSTLGGEIPATETWVELWLWPGDIEAAKQVLAELEENAEAASRTKECPRCHEENPGNFDLCWSCGIDLPATTRPKLRAI